MKTFKLLACVLTLAFSPVTAEAHHSRKHHAIVRHHHVSAHRQIVRLTGREARTPVLAVAMHYLGSGNPTGFRGPWCGAFMNLLEHRVGHSGVPSLMASAWAHYGHPSAAIPGAIAVFRGHVGRVIERVGNQVKVISGNYSHRVGIGFYPVRAAIAYRMP